MDVVNLVYIKEEERQLSSLQHGGILHFRNEKGILKVSQSGILRDKTMEDKLMHISNDDKQK